MPHQIKRQFTSHSLGFQEASYFLCPISHGSAGPLTSRFSLCPLKALQQDNLSRNQAVLNMQQSLTLSHQGTSPNEASVANQYRLKSLFWSLMLPSEDTVFTKHTVSWRHCYWNDWADFPERDGLWRVLRQRRRGACSHPARLMFLLC